MFKNKPKNNLNKIFFPDGRIKHVAQSTSKTELSFADFSGTEVSILFYGVKRLTLSDDSCEVDIIDSAFTFAEGNWTLVLLDDDNNHLLEIVYSDTEIAGP